MNSNKKILVVDDTVTNVEILLELLGEDYDLLVAVEGESAIEIANEDHPDLILLDIMMPHMDGYEVCRRLKQNHKTKDIPIMFITAKNEEEDIEKAYELGGIDYITKPFRAKELKMRVKREIKLQQFTKELEESIKVEKELNFKKDLLMAHQSRLAQMGEMIDAVAHQWKQPISIIQMSMNAMQFKQSLGELNDEMILKTVDKTNKQIKHMSETLDVFRDFFRPNREVEDVNIKNMIESLKVLVGFELNKNRIELDYNCKGDIYLKCTEDEIKHVMINIINNSKDAFIDNGIREDKFIKVDISADKENLTVKITDNAGGIPTAAIDRIFDANFTTKEDGRGTGIGLYISKMIIEKRNGTINVSNNNEGAVFEMVFPLVFN